jgi:Fe-S-cluster containining protein
MSDDAPREASAVWYEAGLSFTCTGCGYCCSGEPGHVWVNQEEIARLAGHLGLEQDEFEKQYVRVLGSRRSLHERFDGDCMLLDAETRACTVYEARPVQCRTWPFWPASVETDADWRQTCESCPGAGQGRLYSVEEIRARLRERAEARERD